MKRIKNTLAEKKRRNAVSDETRRHKKFGARKPQVCQYQEDTSSSVVSALGKGNKTSSNDERKTQLVDGCTGAKKRWKFILLGLIFGWFGAHYIYTKRWLMLMLTLGSLATGVVITDKLESIQMDKSVQMVQQAEEGRTSAGNGGAFGALSFVFWLVLWLGGALFVKKDGKGNRM